MSSDLEYSSTIKSIHQCRKCSYVTTSFLLLQNHAAHHNAVLQQFTCFKSELEFFYCQYCDFKTFYTRNFIEHVQRHKQNKEFKSGQYNFKITNKSNLSCDKSKLALQEYVHYTQTSEQHVIWFNCTKCPYRSEWKESLKAHVLQNHTPDEDIEWHQCDLCPARFKQKRVLKKHKKNIHKCGITFTYDSSSNLQRHTKWKENQCNSRTNDSASQDRKRFRCDQCSLEFDLRRHLGRHITLKHNNKWYHCTDCAYKCIYSSSLKKHILRNHATPEDPRWLRCPDCTYKCEYSGSLKTHIMKTHTLLEDPRRFHCTECDYKSKDKSHLKRHIEAKHTPPEEIKWFHCTECTYRGKCKSNLRKHVMMKHTPPEDLKWFHCTGCEYKSKNRTHLKSHIIRQHGDWYALEKFP